MVDTAQQQDGFLAVDIETGAEFVAVLQQAGPVQLMVYPTSLEEDDKRHVAVVSVSDTETGEEYLDFQLPIYSTEEFSLWAAAVRMAVVVMAYISKEESDDNGTGD